MIDFHTAAIAFCQRYNAWPADVIELAMKQAAQMQRIADLQDELQHLQWVRQQRSSNGGEKSGTLCQLQNNGH